MSDVIEIVFEEVDKIYIADLVKDLIGAEGWVSNVFYNDKYIMEDILEGRLSLNEITLEFSESLKPGSCLILNIDNLKFGNLICDNALVRANKYDDKCDIDLTVDIEMTRNQTSNIEICSIFDGSAHLSNKYNVMNWYAGMEPASDLKTRYFTKESHGPLWEIISKKS